LSRIFENWNQAENLNNTTSKTTVSAVDVYKYYKNNSRLAEATYYNYIAVGYNIFS
jgi:hypothetical protein